MSFSTEPDRDRLPPEAQHRLRESEGRSGPSVFTSGLSVSEFLLLRQADFTPLGLVMGSSIYHLGYRTPAVASRELDSLTRAMYHARQLAFGRMEAEAKELGADGIVGVRLNVRLHAFGHHVAEFFAIGTAVRGEGDSWRAREGRPFTSDLSGQDFWRLLQTGHAPVAFVMGVCVYHLGPAGIRVQASTQGQELTTYTRALYDARELAMDRMQAEAQRDGALGVVGVRVQESSHTWGSHRIEFLAVGTSIRRLDGRSTPRPDLVLDLNR